MKDAEGVLSGETDNMDDTRSTTSEGFSEWEWGLTKDMSDESIVTFNVGGSIFQTLQSTLRFPKRPVYRLRDVESLERHWDETKAMYFFDRDPGAFQSILNYLRTGVLHLPHHMCSPEVNSELLYWGVPCIDIQPCCWKDYSCGMESIENLHKLEKDRKPAYLNTKMFSHAKEPEIAWAYIRGAISDIVSEPSSSGVAKVYGIVSIVIVISSIVNFAMSTTFINHVQDSAILGNATTDEPETENHPSYIVKFVDILCACFFTFDLIAVLVSTPEIMSHLCSSNFWIDFLALAPDLVGYQDLFNMDRNHVTSGRQFFSLLRYMRLFRVVRLMIRVTGVMTILYTLWASRREIYSLILILMVSTLIFGSAAFFAEDMSEQGEMYNVFIGCWWSITTLTTLGYGDIEPHSVMGQVVGSICAFSGVILLGITVPSMVTNFITFHNLIHYLQEREQIFLYRMKGDLTRDPKISYPDWL